MFISMYMYLLVYLDFTLKYNQNRKIELETVEISIIPICSIFLKKIIEKSNKIFLIIIW